MRGDRDKIYSGISCLYHWVVSVRQYENLVDIYHTLMYINPPGSGLFGLALLDFYPFLFVPLKE